MHPSSSSHPADRPPRLDAPPPRVVPGADEATWRAAARLLATIEATSDFVGTAGADGTIEFLNRAGRRLLGLADDADLAALKATDFHPPETLDRLRTEGFPTALRDGAWSGDGILLDVRGERIPVSIVMVAHPDPNGGPPHFSAIMRDLRDRERAEAALAGERAFLTAVLDSLSENVSVCDAQGRLTLFNRATCEVHGRPADGTLPPERWNAHYGVFLPDGETPFPTEALPHVRVLATGEDALGVEYVVQAPGRPPRVLVANAHALRDATGAFLGSVCAARDMTAAREAERRLRASEARFRTALDAMLDAFFILRPVHDAEGGIVDFEIVESNRAGASLLGTELDDLIGVCFGELVPVTRTSGLLDVCRRVVETGERYDGEYQTQDPRTGATWLRLQVVRTAEGLAVTSRDITEKKRAEAALLELAVRDDLTGLLNRRGFRQLAEQALRIARRDARRDAVLALDLNGFKAINDTFGHAAGDDALRAVVHVFRATLREVDIVARFGGDEFVIYAPMLHGDQRPLEARTVAARLRAAFARANAEALAAGRPFAIDAAIGVALAEEGDDLDALLARADAALYAAKGARG